MFAHSAFSFLSTALFLVAPSSVALAQDVRHTFSAEQIECAGGGPRSRKESEAIVHEWRSNGALHLEFWDSEDGERLIDRRWSRAQVKGNNLILSYRFTDIEYEPNQPIIGCSFPVRISFDLYGLNRREYKLSVEVTAVVRRDKVGG